MNIEEIVKAWKSEEEIADVNLPANPVGAELSDEELQEVSGGFPCPLISACLKSWTGNL
ncbi:hypothetical protein KDH_71350 [Dictyobacter sp. S3.2.2.5]|uniref:Mersacidin/lichenicidin family type 2 lantibiotic n=1 Tax=Dictyobacter halimunensis TaxID=3026934 RepID=A0ABQ6G5D7_9CHLR|nr:hypothetical protein KDH_71350 [Dictyobacter sp. S3.2.2.5]